MNIIAAFDENAIIWITLYMGKQAPPVMQGTSGLSQSYCVALVEWGLEPSTSANRTDYILFRHTIKSIYLIHFLPVPNKILSQCSLNCLFDKDKPSTSDRWGNSVDRQTFYWPELDQSCQGFGRGNEQKEKCDTSMTVKGLSFVIQTATAMHPLFTIMHHVNLTMLLVFQQEGVYVCNTHHRHSNTDMR